MSSTLVKAEDAIRALSKAGFDATKLSLIGNGYHSEEQLIGFYSHGDRIKSWGRTGAFWGGIWGLLLAPAVFFVPGIGLLALAGPSVLVSGLEGAALVGGLSALGAALSGSGIGSDKVIEYETALKADKYVLMVHGSEEDVAKARSLLAGVVPPL